MKREAKWLRLMMAVLLGVGSMAGATAEAPVAYRFDEVRSKVVVDSGGTSAQAEPGAPARGGDVVRTGWRGQATVSVDAYASRFEIYPGSRVKLASERPGVIVLLERGRIKAMFDAFAGKDERIVETPGALLAVRGTRYGVEVDASGDTVVSVFEGLVEVRPFDPSMKPLLVRPGEVGRFGPKEAPRSEMRGMTEKGWTEHGGTQSMPGMRDGQASGRAGETPMSGRDSGGGPGSQSSGSGGKKPH